MGWLANRSRERSERLAKEDGGEGGIRTPVPVTRQDAFEAPPLRPLRYLSVYYYARGKAARCALGPPLRGGSFQPSLAGRRSRSSSNLRPKRRLLRRDHCFAYRRL